MTKAMKATAITPVILCADDFGISPGVNAAILDLAAQGRLSAVSCMSAGAAWEEGAQALRPWHDRVAVGLHLTLTHLPPLTGKGGERLGGEKRLLLQSWGRCPKWRAFVEGELRAQVERFVAVWGAPPDFIDGHQHVHVLPVVRDVLLRLREQYAPRAWLRNVVDLTALADSPRYAILAVMGWRFRQLLRQRGIPHNARLRGLYNYHRPADFAALMERWCAPGEPVLVYCHPGFPDAGLVAVDAVLEPRRREHDFLGGEDFGRWPGRKIQLVRHP